MTDDDDVIIDLPMLVGGGDAALIGLTGRNMAWVCNHHNHHHHHCQHYNYHHHQNHDKKISTKEKSR